jgi:hypothetical protein
MIVVVGSKVVGSIVVVATAVVVATVVVAATVLTGVVFVRLEVLDELQPIAAMATNTTMAMTRLIAAPTVA